MRSHKSASLVDVIAAIGSSVTIGVASTEVVVSSRGLLTCGDGLVSIYDTAVWLDAWVADKAIVMQVKIDKTIFPIELVAKVKFPLCLDAMA